MDEDFDASKSDKEIHEVIAEYHRLNAHKSQITPKEFVAKHPQHAIALQRYFEHTGAEDSESHLPIPEQTMSQSTAEDAGDDHQTVDFTLKSVSKAGFSDSLPREFGRYKILDELGRGAMGAVYLAHDSQLDRKVALKIPQFSGAIKPDQLKRFYREARAAGRLHHPGICPVYDVGEIAGQHFITMAFIEGRTLRDYFKNSDRLESKHIAHVIAKIAVAMAEAHDQGVVHRDLKPANIMMDKNSDPVVMDFGLARRAAENEVSLTHTGTVIGTPAYMSPEQVDGDRTKVGPAADIYSLGVIFYELLSGKLPFTGTLTSVLKQIATEQPKPPSGLEANVDPKLDQLCLAMMAKNARDRPSTMHQVAKVLSRWSSKNYQSMGQSERHSETVTRGPQQLTSESTTALEIESNLPESVESIERTVSLFPGEKLSETTYVTASDSSKSRGKTPYLKVLGGISVAALLAGAVFYIATLGDERSAETIQHNIAGTDSTSPKEYETINALRFTGNQGLDDVRAPIPYFDGPFTMECWVQPFSGPGPTVDGKPAIRGVVRMWNQTFLQMDLTSDEDKPRWAFVMAGREKDTFYVANSDLIDELPNQPIHLAAVFDDSRSMRLFVNGVLQTAPLEFWPARTLVQSKTLQLAPPKLDDPLMIGMYNFEGIIDEVRISSCARYNDSFLPSQKFGVDPQTVGLYHLDEGEVDVLRDSSGQKNNGRIRNVQWLHSSAGPEDAR